jgi:hypothetical protein
VYAQIYLTQFERSVLRSFVDEGGRLEEEKGERLAEETLLEEETLLYLVLLNAGLLHSTIE